MIISEILVKLLARWNTALFVEDGGDISLWFLVLLVVFCASYLFVDLASLEDGPAWDTVKFCPSLHPIQLLPALFCLSAFYLFLSYNFFFLCKSCCFSMLLMKLMNNEEQILAFIVVSFCFGVPILVRFLKEWRIFVFSWLFLPSELQHFTSLHSECNLDVFLHSKKKKISKAFIDKFDVLFWCLWSFVSVLVFWLLEFPQTYIILFVFILWCQIILHSFVLLLITLWFIFTYLQQIVHRYIH